MSTLAANLGAAVPVERVGTWKRRAIAILLMAGIASFFWVDSRYPVAIEKISRGRADQSRGHAEL
jgi:hypothetical protein